MKNMYTSFRCRAILIHFFHNYGILLFLHLLNSTKCTRSVLKIINNIIHVFYLNGLILRDTSN